MKFHLYALILFGGISSPLQAQKSCVSLRQEFNLSSREVFPLLPCSSGNSETDRLCLKGMNLFKNKTLSRDGKVSCASCHEFNSSSNTRSSFSDGRARPYLRGASLNLPRTPSLLDLGRVQGPYFWNGRAKTLETVTFWPLYSFEEIGTTPAILEKHGGSRTVAKEIAEFVGSLKSSRAPFDEWLDGDCAALSEAEQKGGAIFLESKCQECHVGTELRGAAPTPLPYFSVPKYALLKGEVNYGSDAELADLQKYKTQRVLKSVPSSLRNLIYRGPPYGRFGQDRSLSAFLDSHLKQLERNRVDNSVNSENKKNLLSFLLISLRSKSLPFQPTSIN